jgi:hypothetical protein
MMASAQLLQQKLGADLNEQSQECLDRIITSARNMASLIKELGQPMSIANDMTANHSK